MRAVVCSEFGPLDGLVVEEREPLPCGPGQVRVTVTATGVSYVDALIAQGRYQIKPRLPFVPGNEVAGTVAETGEGVTSPTPGDRVFATVRNGGFATEVVVPAGQVYETPANLTDGQAATFAVSYLTAAFALRTRAEARPGQSLLVLGAGGGVGLAAVDVGRAMGLRVLAAASTADKRAVAAARGAEAVVDSSSQDVKATAREFGGGTGVDLVYDPVGGALGEECLRALGDDGQFLVVGFASGDIPRLPANQVLLRNRRVVGVEMGSWADRTPEGRDALLRWILGCIAAGTMSPVEPSTYPFASVAGALQDQLDRKVTGKAALVP